MRKLNHALLLLILCLGISASAQEIRPPDALRFGVIGDSGTGGKEAYQVGAQLKSSLAKFPMEFVIMLGDNLYGAENARDFVNKFEKPFEGLLAAGIRFYASLGNHDDPARQTSYKLFNMGGKKYYSFKPKAGIRFFALDSNYMDKTQLGWLENELKASGSEWKVIFFHHPIYSSGERHGSNVELRTVLEPLMLKYGVDVVFSGHEHFYERIKPQKGINYIILGSSSKLRRGNIADSALTAKGFDQDNVFMLAEIAGDRMSFQVITRDGKIVDSGEVRRAERQAPAALAR